MLRARQQPARNSIDSTEKHPKNNKNKKQERKQTQYLTRFGNLPTSSRQERDFIDSTTNTICTLHTIQEGSSSLFIAKKTQEFRKPRLDSSPIQKRSPNPERKNRCAPIYACRPTGQSTDPVPRLTSRSTVPVDHSFVAVDRVMVVHVMHTSRLGGRLGPSPGLL